MALIPVDEIHALQIQAGALGRKVGHAFEDQITRQINSFSYPLYSLPRVDSHVLSGDPATLLLSYLCHSLGISKLSKASALSTGALATSELGKKWLMVNGISVSRCKSDLVITLVAEGSKSITIGVSTKQCNNAKPTNAQLYFTTARAFVALLQNSGLMISDRAVLALRQFCGDVGFRPCDDHKTLSGRLTDPRRFFWEEIDGKGRSEWESLLTRKQRDISQLLFQKAYLDDPFIPEYVLHKTKRADSWQQTEVAIYSVDELLNLSQAYRGFYTKPYSVNKGSYRDPLGVEHLAPRFGIIQMQRGGQAQHPEQLQFNLEAGYFYKI